MALTEETAAPNSNNEQSNEGQSASLEGNVKNTHPKKKFYNTVFATKMRNKKKEEKLAEVGAEEALTSCKAVTIDVTRLNSNAVPKLVSSVGNKKRRKRCQWNKGIDKKKKKPQGKGLNRISKKSAAKRNTVNTNHVDENCNKNENENMDTSELVTEDKVSEEGKQNKENEANLNDKISKLRRKSLRLHTPLDIPTTSVDLVSDAEPILEEKPNCSRTEPFVGKLITKKARSEYIDNFLKEQSGDSGPKTEVDKEPVAEEESKGNEISTSVKLMGSGSLKAESSKDDGKSLENRESTKMNKNKRNKDDKSEEKRIKDYSENARKDSVNEDFKKPLDKTLETKDDIERDEINCRRTVPFKGKNSWKPKPPALKSSNEKESSSADDSKPSTSGISDTKSSIQDTKIDSTVKSDDAKSSSSSKDLQKKEDIVPKTTRRTSEISMVDDDSTSFIEAQVNKSKTTFKKQNSTDSDLSSESKIAKPSKTGKSSKSSDDKGMKHKKQNSISSRSDCSDSKSVSVMSEDEKDTWSCQRTKPYLGWKSQRKNPPSSTASNSLNSDNNACSSRVESLDAERVSERLTSDVEDQTSNVDLLSDSEKKIDSTFNSDDCVKPDSAVSNGEWKFRRKRLNTDGSIQTPSKKSKVKSSQEKKGDQKSAPVSPERTICSLYSMNCTKHAHHQHLQNGECPTSLQNIKQELYVTLTRLEDLDDPEVLMFLIKTGPIPKIKESLSNLEETSNGDNSNLNISGLNSSLSSKDEKQSEDSLSFKFKSPETSLRGSQSIDNINDESKSVAEDLADSETESMKKPIGKPKSRVRRRISSTTSNESLDSVQSRRKKQNINYVEDDSESDNASTTSYSTRSRSQRLSGEQRQLRDRTNTRTLSTQETDENDMEVEQFSNIGEKRTSFEGVTNDLLPEEDDSEMCEMTWEVKDNPSSQKILLKRSKSVMTKKIRKSSKRKTRSRTSSFNVNNDSSFLLDHTTDQQSEETTQNPENEESSNVIDSDNLDTRRETRSSGFRTPSLSRQVSRERLLCTPKSANKQEKTPASGRKSRASGAGEFRTPRKTPSTSSHGAAEDQFSANEPTTPLKTKSHFTSGISLSSFVQSPTHHQVSPASKDLKVQLIKLESVCNSYEDYSASEIEILTDKYVDLLMNSNFSCDNKWQIPMNYHRPNEPLNHSEFVSDDQISTAAEEPSDLENIPDTSSHEKVTSPKSKQSSPKKCSQQDNNSTLVETAVEMPVDEEQQPMEEENLEAPELPSETDKNQTTAETDANQDENIRGKNKSSKSIVVNGMHMSPCSMCNKIFVSENLLVEHLAQSHKTISKDNEIAASAEPAKGAPKKAHEAPGPASKKQLAKTKKKFRYSQSLKCTVCLVTYETKEQLFEHIITHNEQELQQAYKMAKEKERQQTTDITQSVSEDSEVDREDGKGKAKKDQRTASTDSVVSSKSVEIEEPVADDPLQPVPSTSTATTAPPEQQVVDLEDNDNSAAVVPITATQRPITICACHAHETTHQDIQIEMVLLCKTCRVVFRRNECFEVHYRTSPECNLRRKNGEVTRMPKLFCSGCPCVLDSLMDMRTHLEDHAKKNLHGTVTFICNICKVAFFGVGGIFYNHWFNHTKTPDFVASRHSFPKLSVVSVLEDTTVAMTASKSQEGFFYIAEHVCRLCRLPFSSEPELQRHKQSPCQPRPLPAATLPRLDIPENKNNQIIKLICDLCKKYYVNKDNFDRHCNERNHLKTPIAKFSRVPINPNQEAFVCSLCKDVRKSLDDVKEHWKRVHSPIMELYTCKTCNVVPSNDVANYTYQKFEKHCRLSHKSEVITCLVYFVTARYVCHICKFGFATEKSMKEHEAVHQKQSTEQSSVNAVATIVSPGGVTPTSTNQQTATLWVAGQTNDNGQTSSNEQDRPVYVHYYSVNGLNGSTVCTQEHSQIQVPNPNQINFIQNVGEQSTPILSTLLQSNQQQSSAQEKTNDSNVETIFIDSRSNSPILDATPSTSSASNNKTTAASPKKSYMTMVNPDFESMLGNGSDIQTGENSNSSVMQTTDNSSSCDSPAAVVTETLTPQPFEVVLVTDDLSENSNGENPLEINTNSNQSSVNNEPAMPKHESSDNASTKSFIRVRSMAELQRINVQLCSECGLSFDSRQAFEVHQKQHEHAAQVKQQLQQKQQQQLQEQKKQQLQQKQQLQLKLQQQQQQLKLQQQQQQQKQQQLLANNSTPVQKIQPMVTQPNKDTTSDRQQNNVFNHIKQRMVQMTTRRSPVTTAQPTRMSPSVPSQPQNPQFYYPTNNANHNTNPSNSSNYNYNNYSYRPGQQQQQQSQQQRTHQMPPMVRRVVNPNSVINTATGHFLSSRGAPPAYPGTSNNMSTGRSSSIQLPERNTAGSSAPPKRPSGAATRIPQQSLPSFEELTEHRQGGSSSYIQHSNPAVRQYGSQQNSMIRKMLNSNSTETSQSNSNNSHNNITNQQQIPAQQQKIIYSCKVPNCNYRSENFTLTRLHEKNHYASLQQSTMNNRPSQMQRPPQNQQPQQQQQRSLGKYMPVSTMPERPRYPPTNNRSSTTATNITSNKAPVCSICRLICASNEELLQHTATAHNNSNQCCYICDYCPNPLLFDTEDALRKHMHIAHNHSCGFCSKRYPTKEELMSHIEVHARNT